MEGSTLLSSKARTCYGGCYIHRISNRMILKNLTKKKLSDF